MEYKSWTLALLAALLTTASSLSFASVSDQCFPTTGGTVTSASWTNNVCTFTYVDPSGQTWSTNNVDNWETSETCNASNVLADIQIGSSEFTAVATANVGRTDTLSCSASQGTEGVLTYAASLPSGFTETNPSYWSTGLNKNCMASTGACSWSHS